TNDIRLNDSIVSSNHAKIVTVMNTSYIQDLGSTNGTFVNEQRVGQQRLLRPNDIITIGMYEIMFFADDMSMPASNNTASDKTQIAYPRQKAADTSTPAKSSDNPFLNKR
ncbi:MAG: FHA domain-containing protein, partial [Gammaproteobacteria bacterium]|nr:FHA domain-containing protein [Gammaproteobacteria bacterium]